MVRSLLITLFLVFLTVCVSVKPAKANTFTVTNINDSGNGSLRWAINQANANPVPDTITFNISNAYCATGICYILPASALPVLTDNGTTIDGYTQPGASPATDTTPATIVIQIKGGGGINNNGLNIISADNLIRGLSITGFNLNGIGIGALEGGTGSNNVIAGNFIGIEADGTTIAGNALDGIFIGYGAQDNLIGGDQPAHRNIISGNGLDGVALHGNGTDDNKVSGNYIGQLATRFPVGNDGHGVRIYGGAQNNTIGGDNAGDYNSIYSSAGYGIRIAGVGTSGNAVSRNVIFHNEQGGVSIDDTVGNTIGPGNNISYNHDSGVEISGSNATGNVVLDNYIGLHSQEPNPAGNLGEGVYILGAHDNTIGPGNVISGNHGNGIWIDDSDNNTVIGNYIGLNVSGTAAVQNHSNGIFIGAGSVNNLVGGDNEAERNVISGNDAAGIQLGDSGTADNTISGNYIGLGANGSTPLPNSEGIEIGGGVQDITIGGPTAGERNVISGNDGYGVWLHGSANTGIVIQGNYIGTDANGSSDRGNTYSGVAIWGGAQGNTVGGDTPGARNVISGNGNDGVEIVGAGTANNTVLGNYIGADASGLVAIGNDQAGVKIGRGAQDNIVGGLTAGERNVISGNQYGVLIRDEGTSSNLVSGNYIGTAVNRQDPLGNHRDGVLISFDAQSNGIGPGNTIAHNGDDGVGIDTPLAFGNLVLENSIFDNFNLGIDLTNGANHNIQPPVVESSTVIPLSVSGTACGDCLVEVFSSQTADGEGQIWLGQTLANASGQFTLAPDWMVYPYLTATASIPADGTSEFSAVFIAQLPDLLYVPIVLRQ